MTVHEYRVGPDVARLVGSTVADVEVGDTVRVTFHDDTTEQLRPVIETHQDHVVVSSEYLYEFDWRGARHRHYMYPGPYDPKRPITCPACNDETAPLP